MKTHAPRGFTLIELLVVIAIIGILASLILATLVVARDKGTDSKVKAELNTIHTQAEFYANANNNTFVGMCALVQSAGGLANLLSTAAGATGAIVDINIGDTGAFNQVTCHEGTSAWAIDAALSNSTAGTPRLWCVDSGGNAKFESTGLTSSATSCA